jgi:prolipoprotein diacylglyceryltransferase
VSFEDQLLLDMGQILSIPFIVLGIGFIILGLIKTKSNIIIQQANIRPDDLQPPVVQKVK